MYFTIPFVSAKGGVAMLQLVEVMMNVSGSMKLRHVTQEASAGAMLVLFNTQ